MLGGVSLDQPGRTGPMLVPGLTHWVAALAGRLGAEYAAYQGQ
jgi:hypothetical protein